MTDLHVPGSRGGLRATPPLDPAGLDIVADDLEERLALVASAGEHS